MRWLPSRRAPAPVGPAGRPAGAVAGGVAASSLHALTRSDRHPAAAPPPIAPPAGQRSPPTGGWRWRRWRARRRRRAWSCGPTPRRRCGWVGVERGLSPRPPRSTWTSITAWRAARRGSSSRRSTSAPRPTTWAPDATVSARPASGPPTVQSTTQVSPVVSPACSPQRSRARSPGGETTEPLRMPVLRSGSLHGTARPSTCRDSAADPSAGQPSASARSPTVASAWWKVTSASRSGIGEPRWPACGPRTTRRSAGRAARPRRPEVSIVLSTPEGVRQPDQTGSPTSRSWRDLQRVSPLVRAAVRPVRMLRPWTSCGSPTSLAPPRRPPRGRSRSPPSSTPNGPRSSAIRRWPPSWPPSPSPAFGTSPTCLAACCCHHEAGLDAADAMLAQVVAAGLEGRTLAVRVALQRVLGGLVRVAVRRAASSRDESPRPVRRAVRDGVDRHRQLPPRPAAALRRRQHQLATPSTSPVSSRAVSSRRGRGRTCSTSTTLPSGSGAGATVTPPRSSTSSCGA